MKTLLRGGYVVSGRGCRRADVLIDGEKVEMLGHIPPELAAQSEVVDVTGCMLFPGFIDAHTHFDLEAVFSWKKPPYLREKIPYQIDKSIAYFLPNFHRVWKKCEKRQDFCRKFGTMPY